MTAPYAAYISRKTDTEYDAASFPGSLPFVKNLDLTLTSPVTFFVGENGSGKSTLLEAIAVLSGMPLAGGGPNEAHERHGVGEECRLADLIRVGFTKRPKDGYFFRAELQAHFATLLEQRAADPYFGPYFAYKRYGSNPLHAMSHGEVFLAVMKNRFEEGLFLLDEPESALSPQRQLALLALIYDLTATGRSQFLIATHSPILMTFPGARIISFDDPQLPEIAIEDTSHYQITRGILGSPESYWKHLRQRTDD